MRILHFLPSLDLARGGPVRAVFDLCAGLHGRGHHLTICTCERGDAPLEWEDDPATPNVVQITEQPRVVPILRGAAKARAEELVKSHDMVHVHGVWDYTNTQFSALARAHKKPYFVSLRGMLDDWPMEQKTFKKKAFLALVGRKHLELAAAVHCTAQAELDQSGKWFPKGRGVVLPNLLDLDPFRNPPGPGLAANKFSLLTRASGAAGAKPSVLFLSRLHHKKGLEVFIRAAGRLKEREIDAVFIIAGTGDPNYAERMQELVAGLELEDRIAFIGHVGGPLKVSLYQACDVFALPTSQENFGFVFPESLAAGTPVITTKGVDIWPELIESGGSRIVDRTPEAFADALEELLTRPELRAEMGARGREWVFRQFDEGALLERYEALYEGAARRGTEGQRDRGTE